MSDQDRILLIDLSSLYWANWHATADMDIGEAFKRTVAQVHQYRDGYAHVAVCCDSPPYWRKDILPEYKAHREAAPPAAVEQLQRVKDRLRADGLLVWESKGFEADDVIAWAVNQSFGLHDVAIVSADKDLHQLVRGDQVVTVSPRDGKTYNAAAVQEKHGVPPQRVRDALAMIGDKSDNVPGIPGIGPKNAAGLIDAFGDLESILKAAAANDARFTRPAVLKALQENAAAARLAYQAIGLRADVPLNFRDLYEERKAQPLREVEASNMDDEPTNGHTAAEVVDMPPAKAVAAPAPATPHSPSPLAVRVDDGWSLALEPRSSKGAWELAGALLNSRLYAAFGSQEAIFAVIVRGRALGMDATTALAAFHNIGGKLCMHADLIAALVLRSGKSEYFEMVERSAQKSTWATKRVGSRREQVVTFTIQDAAAAQLVIADPNGQDGYSGRDKSGAPSAGANWSKYRAVMLDHRCKTQLARMVYPDVVMGLWSPDEIDAEATIIEASAA